MDRKNYKVFFKCDDRGYSLLLTNANRTDSCILEEGIIVILDEQETNKMKPDYSKIADYYCCLGVFTSRNQVSYLVIVVAAEWLSKLIDTDIFKIKEVQFIEMSPKPQNENNEALRVKKLLESGFFYFGKGAKGKSADLSVNNQNKQIGIVTDESFIWNKYLLTKLKKFSIDCNWYTSAICGCVLISTILCGDENIKICLISRVNCQRIGTRFIFRGIDDKGNVANFVETEQCFVSSDGSRLASYIQIRGSVPLFWAQPGFQLGSHKIKFTRSLELSSLAYERHFNLLQSIYKRIQIVNLLGNNEGEQNLSMRFQECHDNSRFTDIRMVNFDLHKQGGTRSPNIEKLKKKIREFIEETHFCWIIKDEMVQKQFGVIRTNCVDCLDRTNAVQTMISLDFIFEKLFNSIIPNGKLKFAGAIETFKIMWKANGDFVSQIYAGSGALGGSNRFADAQKSVKRTYMATFTDPKKNAAIMTLLRPNTLGDEDFLRAKQLLPIKFLDQERGFLIDVIKDCTSFTDPRLLQVFVGTWNVNGGKNIQSNTQKNQCVTDWLINLPSKTLKSDPQTVNLTDIFAIGFEEIVDLTAGNIIKTKSNNQLQWARSIIDRLCDTKTDYMLLNTIQLVGICLFVYIKTTLAPYIIDVSTASVKTGFKGKAGNKGAVAISFQLYNSRFCFVCSHFAAGQSNTKERNDNYRDICNSMRFLNGITINCHDFVFWCGDFNYRIDMDTADVIQLIQKQNYSDLRKYDQLFRQKQDAKVFDKFNEGPLNFSPTYKYDIFGDDYDTSEKSRIPSWTDRILWKVNVPYMKNEVLCQCLMYNRAELRASDHRPVAGLFTVKALQVNKKKRSEKLLEHMLNYGPLNATVRVTIDKFPCATDIPDELFNQIIETLSLVGKILLVRYRDSDLFINYDNSRSVVESINRFNNTCLQGTNYLLQIEAFDRDWKPNCSKMFNEKSTDSMREYPSLLIELIKNINQRSSIIHEDYFFNEDNDDIKDTARLRTRSCSSSHKDPMTNIMPAKVNDLGSSCSDLSQNVTIDNELSRKSAPGRPPPISNSNSNRSKGSTEVPNHSQDALDYDLSEQEEAVVLRPSENDTHVVLRKALIITDEEVDQLPVVQLRK